MDVPAEEEGGVGAEGDGGDKGLPVGEEEKPHERNGLKK